MTVLRAPIWFFIFAVVASPAVAASDAKINRDLVLEIDGRKIFPIGFTMPPLPDAVTPDGRNGIEELAAAGATFMRTGAQGGDWNEAIFQREQKYLDAAAKYGLYCMPFLRERSMVDSDAKEAQLRELVRRFKDHPGLGAWKGDDEPEWGKRPLPPLIRAREIVAAEDPHHPLVIIHAPRGTVSSLKRYNVTGDILGLDIYPIGYPPGANSLLPNKHISMVGDYTRMMIEVSERKQPVWMVLQIAWSGVIKPGKTLRFPTFPEERFMTYHAIINGARGLLYFGGGLESSLSEADRKFGWNWTFWRRVLRPVIEEIGTHSPLYPALVSADSKLPITTQSAGIELCAREVNGELFVLACKREGEAVNAQFTGLPASAGVGEVLYESPRKVEAKAGVFTDWFAPFEVHVYRFKI
ncbi:MAG: hypothetical protein Q7S40_04960 [Opitutaceae bacterium]|nr:hypothetical protein [Opitutaceae bacterium]